MFTNINSGRAEKLSANMVKRPAEFIVNVSLSASNDLQGYLEFVPSGETCRFSSVMDMMRLMQAKMDEYGIPQSTTIFRTWKEEARQGKWGDQMQPNDSQKPKPGTNFLIQVQYRQNSSWQGRIVWLDTKKTMVFRSFMELVMLMQEALGITSCIDQLNAWEKRKDAL